MASVANETGHRADPTVYIVDDDEPVRDSLKLLLEIHGFAVRDYASTEAFAGDAERLDGGCVLLDQQMPRTSGLEFLAAHSPDELGVPVILLTAHGDDKMRARALQLGVHAFLDKPVATDQLLAEVANALATRH